MPSAKIAWTTGAGSGIGRGVARRLASDGWQVAVSGRTADSLASLAAEYPGSIHPFALDITDADAVRQCFGEISAQLGLPDLTVFSAGMFRPMMAKTFDLDTLRATFEVNVIGTGACLATVMPAMIKRGSGHIAVVASVTGYYGLPSAAAYGATKAALINMCEALQPDLARHGVQISVINPGFVKTPLTDANDFSMPFLMDVDTAVEAIMAGLRVGKFEIAFPWQMRIGLKTLARLPNWLRLRITRGMVR